MATDIGTRIKRSRERKRWTQRQLAEALQVNIKTVDNWENGRTSPRSSLGALEAVLGISLDEPEPKPLPPGLLASIRRDVAPEDQDRVIDWLRNELSPPPPTEPGEEGESGAQPGAGLAARWYAASAPRCACRSPAGAGT